MCHIKCRHCYTIILENFQDLRNQGCRFTIWPNHSHQARQEQRWTIPIIIKNNPIIGTARGSNPKIRPKTNPNRPANTPTIPPIRPIIKANPPLPNNISRIKTRNKAPRTLISYSFHTGTTFLDFNHLLIRKPSSPVASIRPGPIALPACHLQKIMYLIYS